MPLLSALDDMLVNTLAVIPGLLRRLEYLSGLRGGNGYGHWGLSRVHGERAAQQALREAHEMVLSEVLRTPLRTLVEEVESACSENDQRPEAYLRELYQNYPTLLPRDVGGGSTRHFSSVLHALSALATAAPQHATHPAA
jgi:hypothetical protein